LTREEEKNNEINRLRINTISYIIIISGLAVVIIMKLFIPGKGYAYSILQLSDHYSLLALIGIIVISLMSISLFILRYKRKVKKIKNT